MLISSKTWQEYLAWTWDLILRNIWYDLLDLQYFVFLFMIQTLNLYLYANYMISSGKNFFPVRLLANNSRDFCRCCAWILSHVCIPKEKENFMNIRECLHDTFFNSNKIAPELNFDRYHWGQTCLLYEAVGIYTVKCPLGPYCAWNVILRGLRAVVQQKSEAYVEFEHLV